VCRIQDYGIPVREERASGRAQEAEGHYDQEVKSRDVDEHDYQTKKNMAIRSWADGDKVKASVGASKGGRCAHRDLGYRSLTG